MNAPLAARTALAGGPGPLAQRARGRLPRSPHAVGARPSARYARSSRRGSFGSAACSLEFPGPQNGTAAPASGGRAEALHRQPRVGREPEGRRPGVFAAYRLALAGRTMATFEERRSVLAVQTKTPFATLRLQRAWTQMPLELEAGVPALFLTKS